MKRKRKKGKFTKKKRPKLDDIILTEPKLHFDKNKIPIREKKKRKFVIPDKLQNNKRFKINCRIIHGIKSIENIYYNGRVHGYINNNGLKKRVRELGYTPGLCQISVFNPINKYKGFHLLIKITDDKYPLTELKCLSNLKENGYAIGICNSSKDGIKLIKYYMKGKHKKMNKLGFKGNVKLKDILKYKSIHNPIIKLSSHRYGEYKIHSDTPNCIRKLDKEIIIDGQPQGNLSKYYTWLGNLVGYNPGACDMFLWKCSGKYNGFACEFKYGKNKTQKCQNEFIETLKGYGWYVCIAYSSMEMMDELKLYLNPIFHYKFASK